MDLNKVCDVISITFTGRIIDGPAAVMDVVATEKVSIHIMPGLVETHPIARQFQVTMTAEQITQALDAMPTKPKKGTKARTQAMRASLLTTLKALELFQATRAPEPPTGIAAQIIKPASICKT
ncbi:MAG: hypothetical protein EBZ69_09370 [Alphaproteobacteria bacterium]|nr:hypothetical protein [Alphaproteobacteria bacterium]NDC56991.1 hypothetical protein [Alphaproteobacteria bacterium]NDG05368.1 hypothetical protein [Alphaproteobacteria bacterium]